MGEVVRLGTNAERADAVVGRVRDAAGGLVGWAREHPDEAAIAAAPALALAAATARHPLTVWEQVVIAEAGYWLGVAGLAQYRAWKTRPAKKNGA